MINMNNPLISIIVPVYNGEKYLRTCLDSILSQTYKNWEAILVDDGSKDNSGKICDEYANKDSRFKVIHKENGGVSSARNIGIEQSRGKWITFVDADDMIICDFIKSASEYFFVEEIGAITVSSERITDTGEKLPFNQFGNSRILISDFIRKMKHFVSWGYFLKLSMIMEHNLRFNCSLIMSEDALFLMQYFSNISLIQMLSADSYFYRINSDSVCRNGMNYKKALNHYNASLLISAMLGKSNLEDSAIHRAMCFQYKLFLVDLREVHLSWDEYQDAQQKARMLYQLSKGSNLPSFAYLSSCSLFLYRFLFAIRRIIRNVRKEYCI